ncbi:reticulon-like protein B8 isoform X1 [Henckelia pumila]|uniref:reticulon-like protein B8 isoform X1 n=2 Tax=Henckelia pumila TaxID=405737 RepID=UPI003C6E948B
MGQGVEFVCGKMPEGMTAGELMNNIMETISDNVTKHKNGSFFEDDKRNSINFQFNKLFGRQKPVHHLLGGGKSADVLLWRNKKISASGLIGATVVWVLFEWLNYHFLTLLCFGIIIVMVGQFVWKNASGIINRSPSKAPHLVLPEEAFVNIGRLVGAEVNNGLSFLQDVAYVGNMKQFVMVVASLWAVAMIGSWCNFLTVLYIGFVAAHTLPAFYERYDDKVDGFVYKVMEQLQQNYRKLDSTVLSRIPKGNPKGKKVE